MIEIGIKLIPPKDTDISSLTTSIVSNLTSDLEKKLASGLSSTFGDAFKTASGSIDNVINSFNSNIVNKFEELNKDIKTKTTAIAQSLASLTDAFQELETSTKKLQEIPDIGSKLNINPETIKSIKELGVAVGAISNAKGLATSKSDFKNCVKICPEDLERLSLSFKKESSGSSDSIIPSTSSNSKNKLGASAIGGLLGATSGGFITGVIKEIVGIIFNKLREDTNTMYELSTRMNIGRGGSLAEKEYHNQLGLLRGVATSTGLSMQELAGLKVGYQKFGERLGAVSGEETPQSKEAFGLFAKLTQEYALSTGQAAPEAGLQLTTASKFLKLNADEVASLAKKYAALTKNMNLSGEELSDFSQIGQDLAVMFEQSGIKAQNFASNIVASFGILQNKYGMNTNNVAKSAFGFMEGSEEGLLHSLIAGYTQSDLSDPKAMIIKSLKTSMGMYQNFKNAGVGDQFLPHLYNEIPGAIRAQMSIKDFKYAISQGGDDAIKKIAEDILRQQELSEKAIDGEMKFFSSWDKKWTQFQNMILNGVVNKLDDMFGVTKLIFRSLDYIRNAIADSFIGKTLGMKSDKNLQAELDAMESSRRITATIKEVSDNVNIQPSVNSDKETLARAAIGVLSFKNAGLKVTNAVADYGQHRFGAVDASIAGMLKFKEGTNTYQEQDQQIRAWESKLDPKQKEEYDRLIQTGAYYRQLQEFTGRRVNEPIIYRDANGKPLHGAQIHKAVYKTSDSERASGLHLHADPPQIKYGAELLMDTISAFVPADKRDEFIKIARQQRDLYGGIENYNKLFNNGAMIDPKTGLLSEYNVLRGALTQRAKIPIDEALRLKYYKPYEHLLGTDTWNQILGVLDKNRTGYSPDFVRSVEQMLNIKDFNAQNIVPATPEIATPALPQVPAVQAPDKTHLHQQSVTPTTSPNVPAQNSDPQAYMELKNQTGVLMRVANSVEKTASNAGQRPIYWNNDTVYMSGWNPVVVGA